MAEITHDHLSALADRIENSLRRDVDQLRADVKDDVRGVHARVSELRDVMEKQNGRVAKSEGLIVGLQSDVRVQRHDFANHLAAYETFKALLGRQRGALARAGDQGKPSKAFVAGAVAAVVLLAGVAQLAFDVVAQLLRHLKP